MLRVSQNSHQAFKDGSLIVRGNNTVCPVETLGNFLAVCGPSPGPLFCYTEGRPLTHQLVSSLVQSIYIWQAFRVVTLAIASESVLLEQRHPGDFQIT